MSMDEAREFGEDGAFRAADALLEDPLAALKRGFYVALPLSALGTAVLCYLLLQLPTAPHAWWHFLVRCSSICSSSSVKTNSTPLLLLIIVVCLRGHVQCCDQFSCGTVLHRLCVLACARNSTSEHDRRRHQCHRRSQRRHAFDVRTNTDDLRWYCCRVRTRRKCVGRRWFIWYW